VILAKSPRKSSSNVLAQPDTADADAVHAILGGYKGGAAFADGLIIVPARLRGRAVDGSLLHPHGPAHNEMIQQSRNGRCILAAREIFHAQMARRIGLCLAEPQILATEIAAGATA